MRKKNPAEEALIAAFKRLRDGKPTSDPLKKKAAAGKRLVTVGNVALEAGVSRTLIGLKGCRYEALREEILAYAAQHPRAPVSTALVDDLRAEIRRLKRQLELSDTYNAELLIENATLKKGRGGNYPEVDGVVNFRPDRRRTRSPNGGPAR